LTSLRRDLPTALGALIFGGGVLSLLGAVVHIPRLSDWLDTGIPMVANGALCSSACGVALLCRRASFGKVCVRTAGVFLALVGLLTLSQFLTGLDLGIDDLVSWGASGAFATVTPGRLRPIAALSFALLGLAFVFSTGRGRAQHWAATLGIVAACIVSVSLVGVLYGADELYALPRLTGTTPQTALLIAASGIGLVVSMPDQGLMKALARDDSGAAVLRRLLLPAVILPLTVGWMGRLGVTAGWYDAAFGLVIQAVSQIGVLVALVWWVATSLNRREEQLEGARAAVRESNRMLSSITDNASTAILLMDAGQRCTYMNPAAEELTGFALEEVLARGVTLHELIHHTRPDGSHYPISECPIDRALPTRNQTTGEDVFVHKDGHFYHIAFTASPLRDANHVAVGTVIEVRDISEQKRRAEQLRRQTEQLQHANEELGYFTVIAAHDLQEPLRKIMTYMDVLVAPDADGEKRADAHRRILKAASRMRTLIHVLLDFATLDKELQLTTVDLGECVATAVEELGADSIAEIQVGELPMVEGDPVLLKQLFQNLIDNAVKFSKRDERCRIGISGEEHDGRCVIRVSDNGIGFDMKYVEKIFLPLQRLHRKDEYSGTGIGLAACRKIVHRHHGKLTAHGEVGRGATFIVDLPRNNAL
jgi:PAS domain S-box-containing protein